MSSNKANQKLIIFIAHTKYYCHYQEVFSVFRDFFIISSLLLLLHFESIYYLLNFYRVRNVAFKITYYEEEDVFISCKHTNTHTRNYLLLLKRLSISVRLHATMTTSSRKKIYLFFFFICVSRTTNVIMMKRKSRKIKKSKKEEEKTEEIG